MRLRLRCTGCGVGLEVGALAGDGRVTCASCGADFEVSRSGLLQGTQIAGFEIIRLLGRGGMGEVYLARQLSMDRDVALKVLPAGFASNPGDVEHFLREVRLAAKLDHPNIVTAFDAGEDGGLYYMAMSFVDGRSLEAVLQPGVALAERDALTMARKLAQALDHAWTKFRIIHRDITPGNILIDASGEPKLADMGLSRSPADPEGAQGDVMGTPNYMSPEQAAGAADLDLRTDVYSLGATLHHAVTGQVPHGEGPVEDILRRLAGESLPDPRRVNPQVSENCASLLRVMLARRREDRYADWKALIRDIDFALESKSPSIADPHAGRRPTQKKIVIHKDPIHPHAAALPAGRPAVPARPRSRMPIVVAAVLALVAVAGVIAVRTLDRGPGPGGPAAGESGPERREQDPAGPWQAAVDFAAAHPDAFDEAIAKFEAVATRLAGTKYEPMAKGEAERLRAARDGAADRAFANLEVRAQALVDAKDFAGAAGVFDRYDGAFAAVLAGRRTAAAERCRGFATEEAERADRAMKEAQDKEQAVRSAVVVAIATGDLAAASQACKAFLGDAAGGGNPAMQRIAGWLDAAADADRALLATFEAQKGKEILLASGGAKVSVRVVGVRGDRVLLEQRKGVGWASTEIPLAQVADEERRARLAGKLDPAALGIWSGVACLRARRPDLAAVEFQAAGELAEPLRARLAGAFAGEREAAARTAHSQILQSAGLPAAGASPEEMAARLQPGRVSLDHARTAIRRIEAFAAAYGDTQYAQSNSVAVAALKDALQRAIEPAKPKPKEPRAGDTLSLDLGEGVALELVRVPPGDFQMGSPPDEFGRSEDEIQHKVTLTRGFWIGRYEVTQRQYQRVMGENPSVFANVGSNAPVENVSWKDASLFCERVRSRLPDALRGLTARLPTEAEWEYACRAGTKAQLNSGQPLSVHGRQSESLAEVAWYKANSGASSHPVGQRKPNDWGIHDMHGNIREWCADFYGSYPEGDVADPTGPAGAPFRVLRGGGWDHVPVECRSATRYARPPEFHINRVGFRLAVGP